MAVGHLDADSSTHFVCGSGLANAVRGINHNIMRIIFMCFLTIELNGTANFASS